MTLHVAQVFLRAGNPRFFDVMSSIASLATSTGQWPEAIHPRTHGGCMGDGQHVWAAAEWILMLRNCFVREDEGMLILCSGIPALWMTEGQDIFFGPTLTRFGPLTVQIKTHHGKIKIQWFCDWGNGRAPPIEIRLSGQVPLRVQKNQNEIEILLKEKGDLG